MQLAAIVPSMVVVGIGYPGVETFVDTVQIRARDLTPTPMRMFSMSGGGDAFAVFLADQLHPWLRQRYPDATADMIYFGHSLGGLFGTYLMLESPGTFGRYILSSPSLWWDNQLMFGLEASRAREGSDVAAQAFYGIGSLETDEGRRIEGANLPDGHPAKPGSYYLDMVADLDDFVTALRGRQYAGLDIESVVIDNEFHVTVASTVLSRGLRYCYSDKRTLGSDPSVR